MSLRRILKAVVNGDIEPRELNLLASDPDRFNAELLSILCNDDSTIVGAFAEEIEDYINHRNRVLRNE